MPTAITRPLMPIIPVTAICMVIRRLRTPEGTRAASRRAVPAPCPGRTDAGCGTAFLPAALRRKLRETTSTKDSIPSLRTSPPGWAPISATTSSTPPAAPAPGGPAPTSLNERYGCHFERPFVISSVVEKSSLSYRANASVSPFRLSYRANASVSLNNF